MSTTGSRHITLVEVLIAGGVIVLCAIAAASIHKNKAEEGRRIHCIHVLRFIDGAKDAYMMEYGATNGSLLSWYQLSFWDKQISNSICFSSRGWRTNVPEDCYSIEPYGSNPICRVRGVAYGHALTNR